MGENAGVGANLDQVARGVNGANCLRILVVEKALG